MPGRLPWQDLPQQGHVQVLACHKHKPKLAAVDVLAAQAPLLPGAACWQDLLKAAAHARAWLLQAQPSLQGGQVCSLSMYGHAAVQGIICGSQSMP